MLKLLLKKQLSELFKSYFYDEKKGIMRPKWQIALWCIFFVVIIFGVLGGMFTVLSYTLCNPLVSLDVGWLYFLLMSLIAILLGTFGSVFNTYAGLYLAKDNDLLLSLPIPVNKIIASRLLNVYIMGALYSLIALIPAIVVYWFTAGFTMMRFICGILLMIIVTLIVMLLSCILGWVVAKFSQRFKNKSFVSVFAALLFVAAYYYFYFKANDAINSLLANAVVYGNEIKGSLYVLYLFGNIGEGNMIAAGIFLAAAAALCYVVWTVISRTFFSIAADTGTGEKKVYHEKTVRKKSVFGALLAKEFKRFTSSANYMLNCGLGVLLIPAAGVMMLLKGSVITQALDTVFTHAPYSSAVLLCIMLCMLTSMSDMAVPSVALEGKSIWIPQSLPVPAKSVLRAKACVQLILVSIPIAFASIASMLVIDAPIMVKVLGVLTAMIFSFFSTMLGMYLGVRMANLHWVSELSVIKQSGSVTIILFGTWIIAAAMGAAWLFFAYKIGAVAYLAILSVFFAAAGIYLLHWLDTKGAEHFAEL